MNPTLSDFPFLSAIMLSCILGLVAILVIPGRQKGLIRWVSAFSSGLSLILCIFLFAAYDRTQGGLQFVEKIVWMKSLGIHYFNAVDGFNLPLLLLTGIVHFTGVLTMWELEERVKEFFAYILRPRHRSVRLLHEHGPVFPVRLVRRFSLFPCIRSL